MLKPCEHPMLEHCLSIDARIFAEQCPTYGTYATYVTFWSPKHSCLRLERAQGVEEFSAADGGKRTAIADLASLAATTTRRPCAHGYWFGHCPICTAPKHPSNRRGAESA